MKLLIIALLLSVSVFAQDNVSTSIITSIDGVVVKGEDVTINNMNLYKMTIYHNKRLDFARSSITRRVDILDGTIEIPWKYAKESDEVMFSMFFTVDEKIYGVLLSENKLVIFEE